MKKTLLVAAMMASFTGAAVAQNSVTLYGRLAPSVDFASIKINDKAAATFAGSGLTNPPAAGTYNQFQTSDGFNFGGAGSNWGIRGVEDLGNGLKVSFQYENGFVTSTGAPQATARIAALTVSNAAWGSVGFGRDFAAANTIMAGIRPLTGVANSNNVLGTANQQYSNLVKYFSPTVSGFRVGLSYSFGGTAIAGSAEDTFGTSNKNRILNAGLRYSNGPLVGAALYTQANTANSRGSINDYLIGGTYDLKVVKLHAAYGQTRDGIFTRTNNPLATGAFGTNGTGAAYIAGAKTNQYAIGVTAPVGAGRLGVSFAQKMPGGSIDIASTATFTQAGIAYQYNMSKRTSVSVGYAYNSNLGMIDGVTSNQVGGGILHTF